VGRAAGVRGGRGWGFELPCNIQCCYQRICDNIHLETPTTHSAITAIAAATTAAATTQHPTPNTHHHPPPSNTTTTTVGRFGSGFGPAA
jgi:hypothetical protein